RLAPLARERERTRVDAAREPERVGEVFGTASTCRLELGKGAHYVAYPAANRRQGDYEVLGGEAAGRRNPRRHFQREHPVVVVWLEGHFVIDRPVGGLDAHAPAQPGPAHAPAAAVET